MTDEVVTSRAGDRGTSTRPAPDLASALRFSINGRFLTQGLTGVQRYAREITGALDELLPDGGAEGAVLVPGRPDPLSLPALKRLRLRPVQPLGGHLWEQVTLPVAADGPLISLCNTGPAMVRRQIVCVHDANVFEQPLSYSRAFRTTYRLLLPMLARRAARLVTVSHASADQLARHLPVSARDIVVLPNGHEHVRHWSAGASALSRTCPATRRFVLLIGSRARHKNAALILGMAQALDALGLDLVVAGGESRIFAAEDRAQNGANIHWLGRVSDDDLAWLFGHALCLAFPSWTEGFGLPVLEAMALGCPVVSSNRASMPEVCGEAALLAAPDDPDAWLAHIGRLATSPGLATELRQKGREQARRFSWAASAAGYLDLAGALA